MASIKLNQAELDALSGLGHAAFRLYVAAIRPRMDYTSGTVGKRVRISWQALREWMYVEPQPGVKAVTHTESMVRRLAKQLVKHGLLREIGDKFHIAFLCPLADADNFAQKQADRGSAPQQGARNPNTDNGFETSAGAVENARPDTHPNTGTTYKTSPPTPPRRKRRGGAEQPIDPSAPAARKDDNPPDEIQIDAQGSASSEQHHESANAVGNGLLAEEGAKRHLSWEAHLAWPVWLTDDQRSRIRRTLAIAPEALRDTVIDEWRGRDEAKSGPLANPFGWLAWCAKEAAKPGWTPVYAPAVRARRDQAIRVLASHEAADAEVRARIASIPAGPPPKGALAALTKVARRIRGERS